MSNWYDKEGNPLLTDDALGGSSEWERKMDEIEKLLSDKNYKIIKQEWTPDKKYWVSTVWLGLDYNYGEGPPLIFETMVFKDGEERELERYSTQEEALRGHKKLLKKYSS